MCGSAFRPKRAKQRYCSRACGQRVDRQYGLARRTVERPPFDQLMRELEQSSYLAVGRRYGVSDNAIRKWARFYERECS